MLDEKVDKNWVEATVSDKVGKSEIADLLPDMVMYEQKTLTLIEESNDDLWVKLEEKLMSWDQRMINIRNEFDMSALNRFIETKANREQVSGDF